MKEKKAQEPLLKWKAGSGKVTVKNGGGGGWQNDLALTYGGLFFYYIGCPAYMGPALPSCLLVILGGC